MTDASEQLPLPETAVPLIPSIFSFDTETSGLEPSEGAEILSYAYIVLTDDLIEVSRGQRFFLPKGPVHPRAAAVNGYTRESWLTKGALPPETLSHHIVTDIARESKGRKLRPLGHNVAFDIKFFRAAVVGGERALGLDYHSIDTMVGAQLVDHALRRSGSYKLTELCQRYGITLTNAHDSLGDVEATVALYRELVKLVRGDRMVPDAAPRMAKQGGYTGMIAKQGDEWTFTSGKYAGFTTRAVASTDRGYILWILDNLRFSPEVREHLLERVK